MTSAEIKRVLIEKGITHLYHVNTVATACMFLENEGLLSRGAVEERGLYQTPQQTDEKDKEVDVFYDIFFDSVDIHERGKKINDYGPVVFVYSIDVLDTVPSECIRITKENPMYWEASMKENEKYFLTLMDLRFNYQKGRFNQHLTLRNWREPLSFDYLEKIIVDKPEIDFRGSVANAIQYLQELIDESDYRVLLEERQCPPECRCRVQYESYNPWYIYHRFKISEERL